MSFAVIILVRVLFAACMVFIIGYIFGSFGKRPVLKTISRVAAILVIVLFIAMNILFVRAAIGSRWHNRGWDNGRHSAWNYGRQNCPFAEEHTPADQRSPRSDSTDFNGSAGTDVDSYSELSDR